MASTTTMSSTESPATLKLSRGRHWLQVAVSIFLVYHLLAVSLLPNSSSMEVRAIVSYLIPYANQFGFHTPWQFFSPGPAPTFYLEYEVEKDDDDSSESEPIVWPPPKTHLGFDDRYTRRLYTMRYFAVNPMRQERFFLPWLCRRHPGATAIVVRSVFEPVTGVDQAWLGDGSHGEAEKVGLERRRFHCDGQPPLEDGGGL